MSLGVCCECCVLSDRGLCVGPITFFFCSHKTLWKGKHWEQGLTLWRQNFILNFSTPCILNVNNTGAKNVALWNKRHFEEKKKRRLCSMFKIFSTYICWINTGCPGGNVPDFGRMFLKLKYTDINQNTYIRSWTVTAIMAREVWKYDSCYTHIDYQIHIKTGRNMVRL